MYQKYPLGLRYYSEGGLLVDPLSFRNIYGDVTVLDYPDTQFEKWIRVERTDQVYAPVFRSDLDMPSYEKCLENRLTPAGECVELASK